MHLYLTTDNISLMNQAWLMCKLDAKSSLSIFISKVPKLLTLLGSYLSAKQFQ